jgi:uncharacterized protein with PQ loop repeat/GNAT superfamily N-acetyltransferase
MEDEKWVQILLSVANIFSIISNVPQIYHTYLTKKVDDISTTSLSMRLISALIWSFYSIYFQIWQLGISWFISLFSYLLIFYYKIEKCTIEDIKETPIIVPLKDFNDISECVDILHYSFFNDPYSWSKAVGFSSEKLYKWFSKYYLFDRIRCKIPESFIYKNEKKNITGVCIVEDFNNPPIQPDNIYIDSMIEKCKNIIYQNSINTESTAYISFIAVHKDYRRKHIADILVQQSKQRIKEQGFKNIIAFCTSYKSRYLFERNGYKYIGGVSYKDFVMNDGEKPFISLPNDQCSVMFYSFD